MTARPLSLPSLKTLATGIAGAAVVSCAFFPIYLGGSALAAHRHPLHLYAAFELAIPFFPFMMVPYLSMFVLFVIPPLQLDARELRLLVTRLVVASLVGGVVFLFLPTEIGFADRHDAGIWQPLYGFIYAIDSHYDAIPSFHVIYTATILLIMADVASPRLRLVYRSWLVLVCASTVLTHRHQLLDVASGLTIAYTVRAILPGSAKIQSFKLWRRIMRPAVLAAVLLMIFGIRAVNAQAVGNRADDDALRKLKADILTAINTRNLSSLDTLLHKPFLVTVVTQDSFKDADSLKKYYDNLFTNMTPRIKSLHMDADATELAQIYSGTFAVARGTANETYELGDGRTFAIPTHWTATAMKENGRWTVLTLHDGTDFLDNPVLNAIERRVMTFAALGAGLGLAAGFILGLFVRRRRVGRTA